MKKGLSVFVGILFLIPFCHGQSNPNGEIFIEEFNWKITMPKNFEVVDVDEWAKLQGKGIDAIEDTYDEEVVNQARTIFVFQSGQLNYFESNSQPFDIEVDGDYLESCRNVNEVLYETFKTQLPDIKIDTIVGTEKIDNLEFQKFEMKIKYPNDLVLSVMMFSRLFEKKEFSVNLMYLDESKGKDMLESWRASRFLIE